MRGKSVGAYDGVSTSAYVLDWEQHKAHSGDSYVVDHYTADGAPLADDASLELWLSVGAGCYPHLVWSSWAEGLAQVYIYEAPTVSAEGTPITPTQRNRNSANASAVTVKHTPTVTGTGTALRSGVNIGAGSGGQSEHERARGQQEMLLKPGTTYLLRLTARANNIHAGLTLNWYES